MATAYIGKPISRIDGRAKVTGTARYAGEFSAPGLLYGYVVSSAIARGKIESIDETAARTVHGVVEIFTHKNRPKVASSDKAYRDQTAPEDGSPFRPLYDGEIQYSGQPVALIVAETFEAASYAASLVRLTYRTQPHMTDLLSVRGEAFTPGQNRSAFNPPPKPRGNAEAAYADAPVKIETEYSLPVEHHNPMEPFASTAIYESDGSLTIYDKTQGVTNSLDYVTSVFGLSKDKVSTVSRLSRR